VSARSVSENIRRVVSEREYRLNYGYNVGVATSQFLAALLYGSDPDLSLSHEIGRRIRDGERLDGFQLVVKCLGDRLLGPGHWEAAFEEDETNQGAGERRTRI